MKHLINFPVIASEAKQSISRLRHEVLDCRVTSFLAMTCIVLLSVMSPTYADGHATPEKAVEERTTEDLTLKIETQDAYAFATVPIQKNGAVFMTLENTTDTDIVITEAHSDVAERTELHTHLTEDGIMMMRKVESYTVPAGETLSLEPMGHHVMLMGLKEPLKAGDTFPLTIKDAAGMTTTLSVEIKSPNGADEDEEEDDSY